MVQINMFYAITQEHLQENLYIYHFVSLNVSLFLPEASSILACAFFGLVSLINDISTFVGYLTSKLPLYKSSSATI